MGHLRNKMHRQLAGVLGAALVLSASFGTSAKANVLEDVKERLSGLNEQYHITQTLKQGLERVTNTASDLVLGYEVQPDDEVLEKLAQSWAVTEFLTGENKGKTGIFYFDNTTMRMVEDLTQIGHGYNRKKTPEGSNLHGVNTGVLRATILNASSCTVDWVNYEDEVTQMLLRKMAQKQETEQETEAN